MLSGVIFFLAIALLMAQYCKDKMQEVEDEKKQANLDSVNNELRAKTENISQMQKNLNDKNEKIITLQNTMANQTTETNEHIVAKGICPTIEFVIRSRVGSPSGGYELIVYAANNTRIPLQNISITHSIKANDYDGKMQANKSEDRILLTNNEKFFSETLPPEYGLEIYRIILSSRDIKTPYKSFNFSFKILYNSNYYIMDVYFEIERGQIINLDERHFRQNTDVESEYTAKHYRSLIRIEPSEYMKVKCGYDASLGSLR